MLDPVARADVAARWGTDPAALPATPGLDTTGILTAVRDRRLAGLLTVPQFLPASGPIAMRSRALMTVAVRVMGNLVTDADVDLTARAWRASGAASRKIDSRPLFG